MAIGKTIKKILGECAGGPEFDYGRFLIFGIFLILPVFNTYQSLMGAALVVGVVLVFFDNRYRDFGIFVILTCVARSIGVFLLSPLLLPVLVYAFQYAWKAKKIKLKDLLDSLRHVRLKYVLVLLILVLLGWYWHVPGLLEHGWMIKEELSKSLAVLVFVLFLNALLVEVTFRGIVYRQLEMAHLPTPYVIAGQALAFGLFPTSDIIYTFSFQYVVIWGLIQGIVRYKSKRVWVPVVLGMLVSTWMNMALFWLWYVEHGSFF